METKPSWRDRLRGILGTGQSSRELPPEVREIEASGLFDRTWYLANTPGVAGSGLDPLHHYATYGRQAGLPPGPHFDSAWYRLRYNDVAAAGVDPLLHFIRAGRNEGRSPRPSGADLLDDFQSLGSSCEFGFVQRHFGSRVLSLLGFATTTPLGVASFLESSDPFPGTIDCLQVSVADNGEYMVDVQPYGFRFHTDVSPASYTADQVREHELKRLRFLWRKLQEDIEDGGRIFVLRASRADLRRYGPRIVSALRRQAANHLLWAGSIGGKPPGWVDVESLGNGLMWAHIAPGSNDQILGSSATWYEVCQRAYDLRSRERASRAARPESTPSPPKGSGP
jgi:hypothetical protein